eukprot:c18733_g1_i3.p1 GENE.c18733_g1_i3~~c18733_g1_i3.p1  ORF type:complete len:232 (+),score=30.91 c18733_g1_i3:306-1001(+)
MAYLAGGTLHRWIQYVLLHAPIWSLQNNTPHENWVISPHAALTVVVQAAAALSCLHASGIVHRDLSPYNIMFDAQGKAVLVDFGLAARILVDPTALTAFCGTPEFMAPEVLDRQAYSTAVDWWSLGVVAFTMLLGNPPFSGQDPKAVLASIRSTSPLSALASDPNIYATVSALLNPEPTARIQTFGALLSSPWCSSNEDLVRQACLGHITAWAPELESDVDLKYAEGTPEE